VVIIVLGIVLKNEYFNKDMGSYENTKTIL
jgi:hypothetical protein